MKGKVRNGSMRNTRHKLETHKSNIIDSIILTIDLDYGAMTALCHPTQTDETLYTGLVLKTCISLAVLFLRIAVYLY